MESFKIAIIILILIAIMNNQKLEKMFNKMFNKIPKKVKPYSFLVIGIIGLVIIMNSNKNVKIDFFSQEDSVFQKAYKGLFGVKHPHTIGGMGGPDKHSHVEGDTPIDPITGQHQHRVAETVTSTPEPLTPEPLTPEPLTPEPLTPEPEAFSF